MDSDVICHEIDRTTARISETLQLLSGRVLTAKQTGRKWVTTAAVLALVAAGAFAMALRRRRTSA